MPDEKILTNSEKEIMQLLWNIERPLSGAEIVSLSENKTWKESYIHLLINSLLKKDMIKMEGFIKTTKNYARTFVPTITEEEYSVKLITQNSSFKAEYIPFIVKSLLEITDDKSILNEVSEIIKSKI